MRGRPQQRFGSKAHGCAAGLEDIPRSEANFRVVEVGERVVEEKNAGVGLASAADPRCECMAREFWQRAPLIDPKYRFVQHPNRPGCGHPVDNGRERTAQFREGADVAQHLGVERRAVSLPVTGQKLAFEPRHVHSYGTFRFAGPALDAKIERLINSVIVETGIREFHAHSHSQNIGAAASGVRLLSGRHIRRAHGAFKRLAANAEAAAHLDRPAHAAIFGIIEKRAGIRTYVARAKAEILGKRRAVHDLAGIEDSFGIERPLDGSESFVKHGTEHLLHEGAANKAIAVLAGERAAKLKHEIGDIVRDSFELANARVGFHVHNRPDVQTPDGSVSSTRPPLFRASG